MAFTQAQRAGQDQEDLQPPESQQTQGAGLQLSHLQGDCSHPDPGRNLKHMVYVCLAFTEVNEIQAQEEGLTALLS